MIFIHTKTDELFVFVTEEDVRGMRSGSTRFVDQHQLKGATFKGLHLAYASTNQQALKMIRQSGHHVPDESLVVPEAAPGEAVCEGCQGIMPAYLLNQGRCIVCWRTMAIRRMGEDN